MASSPTAVRLETSLWDEFSSEVWNRRLFHLTWAFVLLGVVVRVVRYLLCFPFWGDELMLIQNLLERQTFGELLAPLKYGQVCPVGFVLIDWAIMQVLGYSEYSLRLFPLLASIAGLVMFTLLARRLLHPLPAMLAVGILAVAYHAIRHSAEVKPYGCDLTVTATLMYLAVWWWQDRKPAALWCLAAFTPIALALSYPAVFIAGGIGLALVLSVWRAGWSARFAFAGYGLALLGSFGLMMATVGSAQYDETFEPVMSRCWENGFLPWRTPLQVPLWLIQAHTGEMLAWPQGDDRGGSTFTTILCLMGIALWWKREFRVPLVMCLAPLALGLVASAMERFPYGASTRVTQYQGPIFILLAASGGAWGIGLARRWQPQRILAGSCVVLALMAVGVMIKDMTKPYKTFDWQQRRSFAQWFWTDNAGGTPLVCGYTDLGLTESTAPPSYVCLQKMYSPRHRVEFQAIDVQTVAPGDQVRVVLWAFPWDTAGVAKRRQAITDQLPYGFQFAGLDRLILTPDSIEPGCYEVFHFVRSGPPINAVDVPDGQLRR